MSRLVARDGGDPVPWQFEIPDSLVHGLVDGGRVRLPDGTECVVQLVGRVVLFHPVRPAVRRDGEDFEQWFNLCADGSLVRHLSQKVGPREAGFSEPTRWSLADLGRPTAPDGLGDIGPAKTARPLSRARWLILLRLLLPFTALTWLAVSIGSSSDLRDRPVLLTTLATIAGPFTGAIARGGQGCCLTASLRIAAVCGPALAIGLLAQAVPLPFRRGQRTVRLTLWALGWLAWLLGGPASFLHAFN